MAHAHAAPELGRRTLVMGGSSTSRPTRFSAAAPFSILAALQ